MIPSDLKESFHERGYLGPLRVFSDAECTQILARLNHDQGLPPLDWSKGWAASSFDYYHVAADDRILDLVTALLGDDVLLWGASLVERGPGAVHPWHTDIESSSPDGDTLSAWIGLANTEPRSSLKVVPFSHRFGITLQQVMQEELAQREGASDADVTRWAQERDDRSGVVPAASVNGEALLFDGRLWHASENRLDGGTRSALLLQYAAPSTTIRIPNLDRLTWPFELYQAPKPPCIVVHGHDMHGVNRTVPAPIPRKGALAALSTIVHSLQLPLEQDPEVGWKPHGVFRGSTCNLKDLSCHASVLDPGRQPHAAHAHDEEELLLILEGEAELILEERRHRVGPRTFAYYPAHFAHTISNTSRAPVTYLMFKWAADDGNEGEALGQSLVPFSDVRVETRSDAQGGLSATAVLDGETRYLRHLHAHVTTLPPGEGYAPHADAHDVAIVVLDGTVETLGERVGPDSVVFYSGGESHGMRNVGDRPAVYLVFEFHGRHSNRDEPAAEGFSRRLWRVSRDPRRLKAAILHRVRRRVG